MKDFVRSAGRLRALPFPARLTYSVFLVFTLVALAFTAWLGADMLGPDLQRIDEYYAGAGETVSEVGEAAAADSGRGRRLNVDGGAGPRLDVPSEALAPLPGDPIPLRKLLEVTHFHLFSMPVYLMILSHLFMLSGMGGRAKALWIALGTAGVALHIAAPWVARSPGIVAKLFYAVSGTLLAAAFLVMAAVPLFEMWRPRASGSAGSA
jgi:hypothetical protein